MNHGIRVYAVGGAEVMRWESIQVGEPGVGQIRIRQAAVGLNYIDIYFRSGVYPAPEFPFTPGLEGMGTVEAIGDDVVELAVGDRVAYASPPLGAYAEIRLMPANRVVKLPDSVDDIQAAAMMLQGMTAEYLLRRTYAVQAGDTIVIHAAAGGVGLIACQWARNLGATVIGTVGSDAKAEIASANGCDYPVVYTRENLAERVREITNGKGVPVVYDSVGKDTLTASLDCLAPRGLLVSFGQSSGRIDAFDLGILSAKGSLYLTRPTLMTYTADRDELLASAHRLFAVVASGAVKIAVNQTFPLSEVATAHRALEGRKTTGTTVLTV